MPRCKARQVRALLFSDLPVVMVAPATNVGSRYDHLNREELLRLLEAREQRDATRFGLVWEANEIERDKALNNDFVALDLVREQCVGAAPWRNLIIEGDNYDANKQAAHLLAELPAADKQRALDQLAARLGGPVAASGGSLDQRLIDTQGQAWRKRNPRFDLF